MAKNTTLGTRLNRLFTRNADQLESLLAICCGGKRDYDIQAKTIKAGVETSYLAGGWGVWVYDSAHSDKRRVIAYQPWSNGVVRGQVRISCNHIQLRKKLEARGWRTLPSQDYLDMAPPARLCANCPHLLTCTLEGRVAA